MMMEENNHTAPAPPQCYSQQDQAGVNTAQHHYTNRRVQHNGRVPVKATTFQEEEGSPALGPWCKEEQNGGGTCRCLGAGGVPGGVPGPGGQLHGAGHLQGLAELQGLPGF